VRLPRELPARAVRRVVCDGCRQPFQCDSPQEVDASTAVPRWLSNPESRVWRYLSIPIAIAAVIVALVLIRGSDESAPQSSSSAAVPAAPAPAAGAGGAAASAAKQGAEVVKGSSFTLALPPGWARTEPQNGATFAAAARDGGADATLWIQRDPRLTFPEFESQSLAQLRDLAGSAQVVDRTTAPTADGTIVTLAADSPPGAPTYDVTLRVAGPYRYYLATTVEPNASREAADGGELIHSSFVPVAR
jgi:hypothetical protein